jgi:NAD(P)-dependent dehydrogenase (short-subunit alcohol dehydrogenase family)
MKYLKEFEGKVAIVTGSGSGIGRSISQAFAEKGASVVIAEIDPKRAEYVEKFIKSKGGTALAIQTDVSKIESVNQMVQQVLDKFSRIDILVNNAGIGWLSGSIDDPSHRYVENLTKEEWDRLMGINLNGFFYCSKAVIPTMKRQRSGVIISIASTAAFVGSTGKSGSGFHYNISKAGLVNLNKTLALQLGPHNIRVNCISPGAIAEPDPDGTQTSGMLSTTKEKEKLLETIPLGRIGMPRDIANVALFLASERASYVHGTTIDVNGGRLIRH